MDNHLTIWLAWAFLLQQSQDFYLNYAEKGCLLQNIKIWSNIKGISLISYLPQVNLFKVYHDSCEYTVVDGGILDG